MPAALRLWSVCRFDANVKEYRSLRMNKEYLAYGVVGIVAGAVLGFLVANWTAKPSVGAAPMAAVDQGPSSVNSSPNQQLPAGHPKVDPSQPVPAGPLPPGAGMDTSPAPEAAPGVVELPSLDPLPASSKEERAEQKFKNIQSFKGLPSERVIKIMSAFKASLGVECTYCHLKDQFEKDDKPTKQTARKMIALVRDNSTKFGVRV